MTFPQAPEVGQNVTSGLCSLPHSARRCSGSCAGAGFGILEPGNVWMQGQKNMHGPG